MNKVIKITLQMKRWQAGYFISAMSYLSAGILAAISPNEGVPLAYCVIMMILFLGGGTILFIAATIELWEKWDA